MRTNSFKISVLALFLFSSLVSAQESVLDLLPVDAAVAVAIRDLSDLKKKGDEFIKESGAKFFIRPSQIFDQGFQIIGVQNGVDDKRPAAILLLPPEMVFPPKNGSKLQIREVNEIDKLVVVVLPVADAEKMAGNFGLKAGDLKPKTVIPVRLKGGNDHFGKFVYLRDKHLFLGNHSKAVEYAATAKPVSNELSAATRKSYQESDLLIQIGQEGWNELWRAQIRQELQNHFGKLESAEEKAIAEQFLACGDGLRFALGAVRIDGGFGLSVETVFDQKKEAVKKFLNLLRSSKDNSSLQGLPEGNLLLAQASRGSGSATGAFARLMFDQLLHNILETQQIIAPAERPLFVGVFNQIWQHLQGNRIGVYLNGNQQQGLFSIVGILDTEDAGKFLDEMKTLARIADGTGLKLGKGGKPGETLDVEKLISELASPSYKTRELATVKLRLLGEPALPYLAKAFKSEDAEVSQRAQKLHKEIAEFVAQRRKDALSNDPLKSIRPTFALVPKTEKLAGHAVSVLNMKIPKETKEIQKQMEYLFGEEWDNIRLVPRGKELVVLIGSDVAMLETALKNLDQNKPGIFAAKDLDHFYKQSNSSSRKIELHISTNKMDQVLNPAKGGPAVPIKAGGVLSSLGLGVEADRLQLNVWVPMPELQLILKKSIW